MLYQIRMQLDFLYGGNMKKIAFVIYVGCVLLFSAFARAELAMPFVALKSDQTPVQIVAVGLDETTLHLEVDGYIPNRCFSIPSAALTQDLNSPNTLLLRLTSRPPAGPCTEKREKFETVVSLPAEAQKARLQLQDKALYVIKVEGFEYEINVIGSELMRVPGFIAH